jgi:Ni,Fe-hydrogenase III large subunit
LNRLAIKNNRAVRLKDIPELNVDDFRKEVLEGCGNGKRIVSFFGKKSGNDIRLFAVLAEDHNSQLHITSTFFKNGGQYASMTGDIPAIGVFEREFYEEFGVLPAGHPWLKPVRYPHDSALVNEKMEGYPFLKMDSDGIHEVGVGPVHAGIIEPGHFRFLCNGENVKHLEIQLGYQHRGVEKLFAGNNKNKIHLAESVAGDSVIAHASCYAGAVESLSGVEITRKAMSIRAVACELERIAMHIGDLSALSNDVAYLPGSSNFGATRTLVINTTLDICGNRFGRGLVAPGGVNFDIDGELNKRILNTIKRVNDDVELLAGNLFTTPSVLSRFEKTGVVNKKTAVDLGLVGPAARASGVSVDVRTDHPTGIYNVFPVYCMTMDTGDVFARAYMRYVEISQSIRYVIELLNNFYDDGIAVDIDLDGLKHDSLAVSMTEGWRGETVHCAITDGKGRIVRYKIKDPSFNNWMGLAVAVRGNGISDFPICNKSFNLSYCGHDL